MNCLICDNDEDVRHIELYIIGSEGLKICHICEMGLVKHIQELRRIANYTKLQTLKNHLKMRK